MKILDCENIESTYASIQNIIGLKRRTLESLFTNLDLEDFYKKNPNIYSFEYAIISIIEKKYKINYNVDSTAWFHATRIFKNNNFCGDILPLGMVINQIWEQLYFVAKKHISLNNWNKFRTDFENNKSGRHSENLYNMKVNDKYHWGPFGFLIKDTILVPKEMGNWDYLGSPEIIYNICNSFKEYTKIDLFNHYMKSSYPVIIKFIDPNFKTECIGFALYYLYLNSLGESVNTGCNYCYDGNGKRVNSDKILGIDKIDLWRTSLLS